MPTEHLTTPLASTPPWQCVHVVVRIRASVRMRPYPARRTSFTRFASRGLRHAPPRPARDIDGNAMDSCPFATWSAGRRVLRVRDFRVARNWRLWEAATGFVTETSAKSFAEDARTALQDSSCNWARR
ncbi:hypothetical protein VTO73DRAFT_12159 [Trametes versicolor]